MQTRKVQQKCLRIFNCNWEVSGKFFPATAWWDMFQNDRKGINPQFARQYFKPWLKKIIWVIGVLRRTVVLWRWLPHRLSKRQSLTTVLLRTPITQMIFFNQGMLLLGSNHFLTIFQSWADKSFYGQNNYPESDNNFFNWYLERGKNLMEERKKKNWEKKRQFCFTKLLTKTWALKPRYITLHQPRGESSC